jgi:hypothetical protein
MSDTPEPRVDPYAPVLPRAVREQVERANQLAREAGIANVPAASEEPVTTEVTEPPSESQEPQEAQPDAQGFQQPEAEPQPSPTPDWEARYNTLQGKYNAEMSELRGQMRAMQEMLTASQRTQPQAEPPPQRGRNMPPPGAREIPQADIDAYGQELIEASQRWAEARLAPVLQDYDRRLLQVEGNNIQLTQVTAAQRVESALDQAMPEWRQINTTDAFKDWLRQIDPFSGQPRQRLAEEAYGGGDIARTLAFFRAFVNEQTAVSPPPPRTQTPQTAGGGMPAGAAGLLPLEVLAVPGRGQTATPPAPGASNGKRLWTRPEITAFHHAKIHGAWRGREAEAEAIERDLHMAQFEGRIQ